MRLLGGCLLFALVTACCGCRGWDTLRVYEKNETIPGYAWDYQFRPSYEVSITDTAARYNIYVTLRHTDAYPFSNIWLLIRTRHAGDSTLSRRVELPLADRQGRWLGSGVDDIFEHRIPIQENARFGKPGTWFFSLEQNMRLNPLPHVMNVGIRIEKLPPAARPPVNR
ncbi:gliding motility lipoprotein GldH [Compostibacter hankyongensis]|uniref:Gliding motility lipoprotein GldH n=1 Tax=Compostibacter hankyongensis TaxID=1007089 RepID=A0ABP8G0F8_9BACT